MIADNRHSENIGFCESLQSVVGQERMLRLRGAAVTDWLNPRAKQTLVHVSLIVRMQKNGCLRASPGAPISLAGELFL